MLPSDPILAVSSPPGRAARGLIRISGDDLSALVAALFEALPAPRQLMGAKARGLPSPGSHLPVLALYLPGPHTFTGTDMLELQLPGNPALLQRCCESLLSIMRRQLSEGDTSGAGGARYAEPGEFTQRAFFAGRIDLTRAEGVAATIAAVSDAQLDAARMLRSGRLGQWAVALTESLAQRLALVEAGIDFTDQDDVVPIGAGELDAAMAALSDELSGMLGRSRSWASLEAMAWVVMVGEPNVGKSTLFNAMLGHERAVASDVAGTTRDVLAEPLKVAGGEVMLVDAAGVDEPRAVLDAAMQAAAREAIERAELVLQLFDHDHAPIELARRDVPVIRVQTRCDLIDASRRESGALHVSARTGAGLDALRDRIGEAMRDRAVARAGEAMVLQDRHRDELRAAAAAIDEVRAMLSGQRDAAGLADVELIAASMRRALDHLGAIGGRVSADDVIGRIFATFCIGK